ALGLGLAAPFTALAFAPALARSLPRPGPWMTRFKEFLAFPMLAAAVWLIWVLAQQAGANGVLAALTAMGGLALSIWALRSFKSLWRWVFGGLGLALVVAALFALGAPVSEAPDAPAAAHTETAAPWSPEAVAQARAQNKTVFVNLTAAWCITCKVNETVVLRSDKVRDALAAPDVAYLVGDWTKRDAAIATELAAHQRAGVPLYLVYKPGADAPELLPQILSEKIVLEALGKS
ncbi:MAG: thioredoxin family protein, partial [Caulobacterales bacterium]